MKTIINIKKEDSIHEVEYSNGDTLYFINGKNITPEKEQTTIESIDEIEKRNIKVENKDYELFQEIKSTYEDTLTIEKKISLVQNVYGILFLIDLVGFIGFFNFIIKPFEELSGLIFYSAVLSWIAYPLTIIVVLSMLYYKIKYNLRFKNLHNKMTLLNKFHFKSKNPLYIQKSINELDQKYVFNKWKI